MKVIRILAILAVIGALAAATVLVNNKRTREASILSGSFENRPAVIAARTSGRVTKICAPEGMVVKKGDLLVMLDPGPLTAELEAQRAQCMEAEAVLKKMRRGARPEEIAQQKAAVSEQAATLDRMKAGSRSQEKEMAAAEYAQAEAALNKALSGPRPEEISRARASLESAQAHLKQADNDCRRYTSLYEAGAVSRQVYEQACEAQAAAKAAADLQSQALLELQRGTRSEDIEAARERCRQARASLNLVNEGPRAEDIHAQEERLRQAEARLELSLNGTRKEDIEAQEAVLRSRRMQLRAAQARLREFKVLSPVNGRVEAELTAAGNLTSAGQGLLRLADPDDIWIKVYLPQTELGKIKPGDDAVLRVDGLGGERIPARIDSIASQGEFTPVNLQTPLERGRQVFAVKLRLKNPDSRIKAGMTASAESMGEWKASE